MIIVWSPFAELSAAELCRILRLRQEVFVVEQRCAYLDADGYDEASLHAMGRDQDGQVTAVARLLPPGCKFDLPSIGRIAVAQNARRFGHGRTILADAIAEAERRYPDSSIRIEAQAYLERFYGTFGFIRTGQPFDEDGIPHLAMIRRTDR